MTFVLAVGHFPPPVHGMALVNERVVSRLASMAPVVRVDIGRSTSGRLLTGLIARAARGIVAAVHACRPSCRSVLVSIPGGLTALFVVPVALVTRLRSTPLALHSHSFAYGNRYSRCHAFLFRVAGSATHVLQCERMREKMIEQYGLAHFMLVSNSAFIERQPSPTRQQSDTFTIGHLSNLTVTKGLDLVLDVARQLAQSGLPITLRLAGPASSPVEQQLLDEAMAELGSVIDYMGPIDPADIATFYGGLDLFLFPSRYAHETQSLVVLEALSFGVPCLTSAVGCLSETSGVTALDTPSVNDLVEVIVRRNFSAPEDHTAQHELAMAQLASLLSFLAGPSPNPQGTR